MGKAVTLTSSSSRGSWIDRKGPGWGSDCRRRRRKEGSESASGEGLTVWSLCHRAASQCRLRCVSPSQLGKWRSGKRRLAALNLSRGCFVPRQLKAQKSITCWPCRTARRKWCQYVRVPSTSSSVLQCWRRLEPRRRCSGDNRGDAAWPYMVSRHNDCQICIAAQGRGVRPSSQAYRSQNQLNLELVRM